MARPLRVQYAGAFYHVIVRGDDRKPIFQEDHDRRRFLSILQESLVTYKVSLHCYVLMSNHFHLLVETALPNLSEFMRQFNITYTSYYNRRHGRSGHLYQGRYKSVLVEKDSYLAMLSRYIHLNPVRIHGVWERPIGERERILKEYPWSSLHGYIQKSKEPFLACTLVLEPYGGDTARGRKAYWSALCADMAYGIEIKDDIVAQSILGGQTFVEEIQRKVSEKPSREIPEVKRIKGYHAQDRILAVIEQETGWSMNDLRTRGLRRQIAMELLYRHGGMKGSVIGEVLGVDYSTVSQGRKRLREKLKRDKELQALLERIEMRLSI